VSSAMRSSWRLARISCSRPIAMLKPTMPTPESASPERRWRHHHADGKQREVDRVQYIRGQNIAVRADGDRDVVAETGAAPLGHPGFGQTIDRARGPRRPGTRALGERGLAGRGQIVWAFRRQAGCHGLFLSVMSRCCHGRRRTHGPTSSLWRNRVQQCGQCARLCAAVCSSAPVDRMLARARETAALAGGRDERLYYTPDRLAPLHRPPPYAVVGQAYSIAGQAHGATVDNA
jgi:hypothetical protein